MYRIFVTSSGKHNNVVIGHRYCFRKKTAKELIDLFLKSECQISVEKLIRISGDIFVWSDCDEGDKVLDYFEEKIWEDDN